MKPATLNNSLRRWPERLGWVIIAIGVAAVWEWAAKGGVISRLFFPPPSQIYETLLELVNSGELWRDTQITLQRLGAGAIVGSFVGFAIGVVLGRFTRLRRFFDPLIAALHPIPKIAIFPLLVVALGIGELPVVVVIALSAFFPMLINVMEGVQQVNGEYLEVAQHFGAGLWQQTVEVLLPGSLPLILTGLRIAVNSALMVTIAAELLTARIGLGAMIANSWYTMRTQEIYISLIVISCIGMIMNYVQEKFIHWLTPWYKSPDSV